MKSLGGGRACAAVLALAAVAAVSFQQR